MGRVDGEAGGRARSGGSHGVGLRRGARGLGRTVLG